MHMGKGPIRAQVKPSSRGAVRGRIMHEDPQTVANREERRELELKIASVDSDGVELDARLLEAVEKLADAARVAEECERRRRNIEELTAARLEEEQGGKEMRRLLEAELIRTREILECRSAALQVDQKAKSLLEEDIERGSNELRDVRVEIKDLTVKNESHGWANRSRVQLCFQLGQAVRELSDYRARLTIVLMPPLEKERQLLYNYCQERRGNIRVFCRLRPCNNGLPPVRHSIKDEGAVLEIQTSERQNLIGNGSVSGTLTFPLDRVFGPESSQEVVYEEISQLLQSALDGYNVTLFAYGATGAGKTFTIQGERHGALRGIIPRAIGTLVKTMEARERQGMPISAQFYLVEIYNEQVRDLLVGDGSVLEVKENASGFFHLPKVLRRILSDEETCMDLILSADRVTAATAANERSSRSHLVFSVELTNQATNEMSRLTLIDLAGSERIHKTGVQVGSTRHNEATAINVSLSCLNDMMTALGSASRGSRRGPGPHIPFRQSKLTQLLKEPICGASAKVAMFANMSIDQNDLGESLNTLRFATKVQGVRAGKRGNRERPTSSNSKKRI